MRWTYIAIAINQFLLCFVVRICSFLSLYSSSKYVIIILGSPPNEKGHALQDNHGLTKHVLTNASMLTSQNLWVDVQVAKKE